MWAVVMLFLQVPHTLRMWPFCSHARRSFATFEHAPHQILGSFPTFSGANGSRSWAAMSWFTSRSPLGGRRW